jgi:hypothetical protein
MKNRNWQQVAKDLSSLSRPVRLYTELILIIIISMHILLTGGKGDNGGILMAIVIGIFSDFGVTGISKTLEKRTAMKIDGSQKAMETVVAPDNNTNIENINVNNEVVNMPDKTRSQVG